MYYFFPHFLQGMIYPWILIVDCPVVNLLVASFAKTARVMHSIFVHAFGCHLLIAFGQVAVVAHELGLVCAMLVVAYLKALEIFQDCFQLDNRFCFILIFKLPMFITYLLDVLLLSCSYGFRLFTHLHRLWSDSELSELILVIRISLLGNAQFRFIASFEVFFNAFLYNI